MQRGSAQAERPATVAAGHEAVAAEIAARVPRGATMQPLTWAAPQHVVVALGASAL